MTGGLIPVSYTHLIYAEAQQINEDRAAKEAEYEDAQEEVKEASEEANGAEAE